MHTFIHMEATQSLRQEKQIKASEVGNTYSTPQIHYIKFKRNIECTV